MEIARNPITGDLIASKTPTSAYRDGWDAIFGKKHVEKDDTSEKHVDEIENNRHIENGGNSEEQNSWK